MFNSVEKNKLAERFGGALHRLDDPLAKFFVVLQDTFDTYGLEGEYNVLSTWYNHELYDLEKIQKCRQSAYELIEELDGKPARSKDTELEEIYRPGYSDYVFGLANGYIDDAIEGLKEYYSCLNSESVARDVRVMVTPFALVFCRGDNRQKEYEEVRDLVEKCAVAYEAE